MKYIIFCATAATLCILISPVRAQQSFYSPSAAMPSAGVFLARQTLEYTRYGDDPSDLDRDIEDYRLNFQLNYGLTKELALMAQIPLVNRRIDAAGPGGSDRETGFGDGHIMIDWRIWKHDTGPLDTMRVSVMAGLDVPVGDDDLDNGGWDPMIGAAFMSIQGRHGFNASARYKLNTHDRGHVPVDVNDGLEDILFLDAAYLYRLAPATFAEDAHGALYAVAELNGVYETNGDTEVRFSPGIMYEARNWVLEASVQVPVHDDLAHRPETDYVLGLGFRVLF